MNRLPTTPAYSRRPAWLVQAILAVLLAVAWQTLAAQPAWSAVGPAGGDARAFAAVPGEPNHLYLGTTNSWIYESFDRGASWHRLSKLDTSDELILDHILVDPANPATVLVAAWKVDHPDGGLWVSHDGASSWTAVAGLRGQSIRAFTQAPSNPSMLFAGTLEGVFRSTDAGGTWTLISPPGSREIHEVESLAVDPVDPNIVYAGTWHLPWKTTDGGKTWSNIKQGLIDDSDVFSIILDPVQPRTVFLSACSGIYKSENGAELFHKIQGIPSTARRTRVLKQDPVHREVVYAGTTEGLYKTVDGGKNFQRMTGPDVIVNDVFVDPRDPDHVLLATDRSGVLYSQDGAASFIAANEGFSGRKVEALLVDRGNPDRIFAGVVNDKTYGGAFVSTNGGAGWDHIGNGLDGRDVFALAQAPDGTVLAGTNHGIFALDAGAASASTYSSERDPSPGSPLSAAIWKPRNTIENTVVKKTTEVRRGKKIIVEKQVKAESRRIERPRVCARPLGRCLAGRHQRRPAHQQGPGRQLAGRPGDGLGRVSVGAAHGATHGRGPARWRGSVHRCRPDLDAHATSDHAHAHPSRGLLRGWHAMAGRARRGLTLPGTRASRGCGWSGFRSAMWTIFSTMRIEARCW